MSQESIKQTLLENGLTANRALGQNFLCDDAKAMEIARASHADEHPVLEIGPGLGALTEPLLSISSAVAAVEIDAHMTEILKKRFGARLTLFHEDFLKTDMRAVSDAFSGAPFVVAANLPYYVTTPICEKLIECAADIPYMTLMLQKEAAERFFAKPSNKNYTPLTVAAQYYYDIEKLMALSPQCYFPQPEVDSVVIRLSRKSDVKRIDGFFGFLTAAFAMRRKTLVNNLKPLGISSEDAERMLAGEGVSSSARAESLAPATLARLFIHTSNR